MEKRLIGFRKRTGQGIDDSTCKRKHTKVSYKSSSHRNIKISLNFDFFQETQTILFNLLTNNKNTFAESSAFDGIIPARISTIHQLFEYQIRNFPDDPAVWCKDNMLTFRELNECTNRLAFYLKTKGIGPDRPVGVCLERSVELIISILGVLKAGGAYVPLDPVYPPERLALMINESGMNLLITQEKFKLLFNVPETIVLENSWDKIQNSKTVDLNSEISSEDLAYVIFTSGSTGQPKGVAMPHGPLVNLIHWQLDNFSYQKKANVLQFAPISFDVSFQEIFSTFCSGGKLFLIGEELRFDFRKLLDFIHTHQINRLFLPFVALEQLAQIAAIQNHYLESLQEIITAGEQLKITPAITQLFKSLIHCTLENQYGPSETHVVTSYKLDPKIDNWPVLPPIGTPISNTKVLILDKTLKSVSQSEIGEIYLGGKCVARGYINQPELTVERFIKNPVKKNELLYKTGDLGKMLPDGNIEFLGRVDHQVKIRGFRIELGEIEVQLAKLPGCAACAVKVQADEAGNRDLVAYLVPNNKHVIDVLQIKAFLQTALPDYMIPAFYVFVEKLPLTPSGKIDRKSLPPFKREHARSEKNGREPQTFVQEQLVQIWKEILKIDWIYIDDDFYDLGGNSLKAVQILSRIQKMFQIDISFSEFFKLLTIERFSEKIEKCKMVQQSANDLEEIEI